MSSGDPQTRRRILDAAKTLLEANPGAPVPMAEVAASAGVSRQALYLHFTDRTTLFLEVSRPGRKPADSGAPAPGRRGSDGTSGVA